ncbi:hypothetical protein DOM22_07615 [Bdellovibrio sp. ZAP7]|uniref:DUF485 domain-containing protein n=1 Tax=Bdellovibrio sp. ZAP7 TaxID=2231053 RepID=UPI00115AAB74|nr:DUF485 domain-containing protein [Bdellovibrio sp. ZAP7]QDK45035.1 hypothetical protein DOM22_07615 [Bdellovibrio sp. ZAP7]
MELILSMSIFFVIITMIFVAVAVFLPEWMGITGKKAKKIIEEQQSPSSEPHSASDESKAESDKKH